MNWVAFLCFLSVRHCTGGAAGVVTRSAVVDTPGSALVTPDVGQPRQPARMSHHPVVAHRHHDPARMPRDGMHRNRDLYWHRFASAHVCLLALTYASFLPLLPSTPCIVSVGRGVAMQHVRFTLEICNSVQFLYPNSLNRTGRD